MMAHAHMAPTAEAIPAQPAQQAQVMSRSISAGEIL
jgi:hypothetical protein